MPVVDYQTRDGLAEFGFSIEFQSNIGWRVYIIFDPFDWGNNQQINLPHESIDHVGRRYVNWSSRIDTLGEARTVAEIWAELAHRAQQQPAMRLEQIQRQSNTEKQKTATPPGPARPNTGKAA
jgi:hypothetical protein